MTSRLISSIVSIFLLVGFSFFASTKQAHAYIDIGSGTMILQALLAGLFGSLFALKVFWARVTAPIGKLVARFKSTEKTDN